MCGPVLQRVSLKTKQSGRARLSAFKDVRGYLAARPVSHGLPTLPRDAVFRLGLDSGDRWIRLDQILPKRMHMVCMYPALTVESSWLLEWPSGRRNRKATAADGIDRAELLARGY
jgi:hypothetical protein